jgi:F-type H+-transporting ATPase subunit b
MFFEPEFWVAVAFVIFAAIVWKVGGFKAMTGGLDSRAERIRAELAEAQRLRQEAAALLSEYQSKREAAERDAAEIVASARSEAERLAHDAEEKMADFVKRRTAAAETKIAQAEAQASAEVRAAAVEAAVRASETVLRSQLQGQAAEDLITRNLADVRAKLH